MTVSEIIRRVDKLNTESNYWFVRTDYGKWFESFIEGNYIAIGWEYITLYEITNSKEETLKRKIAKHDEKIDLSTRKGKAKATTILNKLKAFVELKKDDIVIIPSRNSDRLAFGRIIEDKCFEAEKAREFIKRRKVEWYEIKYMYDINAIFYQVKSNQHTISNINRFAPHIDRVIGNLFKKGDNTHYVLNIEKTDDVNFDDLRKLMDNIKILINNINTDFGFNENSDDFYIKINLQSKGVLELIKKGKSLAILAYLLHLASCEDLDSAQDRRIIETIAQNKKTLQSTSQVIDTLKIDTTVLTKPFKDGN